MNKSRKDSVVIAEFQRALKYADVIPLVKGQYESPYGVTLSKQPIAGSPNAI
jgi:hypothetical protein